MTHFQTSSRVPAKSVDPLIVLQKSQNAVRLNFRQRTKQAVIVDRCRFNRATEVVSEFVTE